MKSGFSRLNKIKRQTLSNSLGSPIAATLHWPLTLINWKTRMISPHTQTGLLKCKKLQAGISEYLRCRRLWEPKWRTWWGHWPRERHILYIVMRRRYTIQCVTVPRRSMQITGGLFAREFVSILMRRYCLLVWNFRGRKGLKLFRWSGVSIITIGSAKETF